MSIIKRKPPWTLTASWKASRITIILWVVGTVQDRASLMRTTLRALRHVTGPRPLLLRASRTLLCASREFPGRRAGPTSTSRQYAVNTYATASAPEGDARNEARSQAKQLPLSCPGCGAPSQTVAADEAGHYTLTRSGVRQYLNDEVGEEDKVMQSVAAATDKSTLQGLGLGRLGQHEDRQKSVPICDRCHNLIHHHAGVPIFHPSIQSIEDILDESPYRHNHIYHVLDAADFPMSLIPNLQHSLNLPRLRTQNRRSKSQRFIRGRVAEVSFIITRSDLLAPKKEQVDGLMTYLREVLRDALGQSGKNVRLGNLRCVSSKRGWWTKEVKEDIWKRGGAGWMVGKVNVGKSNLFEVVYPKGRNENVNIDKLRHAAETGHAAGAMDTKELSTFKPLDNTDLADSPTDMSNEDLFDNHATPETHTNDADESQMFDEDENASLLPPAQPETAYPTMPIISSLPGTTASPIRVPFGNGKGELIDLPGVARSSLDAYVKDEHKPDLVMRSRTTPDQLVIKPGQSLLLGGLIRITPQTPGLVFLAYPFVPLHAHVTSTDKAVAIEAGERESGVTMIANALARERMASAGTFALRWDVTKKRAGPLTAPSAVKLKAEQLPFVVYSADILVEGVGWVELAAQVRRSSRGGDSHEDDGKGREGESRNFPQVEVYSPEGKSVAVRPPMSAWLLGGKKSAPAKARPRRSMSSLKASAKSRAKQQVQH